MQEPNIDYSKYTQYRVTNYTRQQLQLTREMDYYLGEQHNNKKFDWDGYPITEDDELQYLATGVIPYKSGPIEYIPLKYRKPDVTSKIAALIVGRFTSLLFGSSNYPTVSDPTGMGSDFLSEIINNTFWKTIRQLRNIGGSCGLGIIGFHFEKGILKFDLYDPRYTFIEGDSITGEINKLQIVYYFKKAVPKVVKVNNSVRYMYVDTSFVYRRLITPDIDIEFEPLEAEKAENEGVWEVKRAIQLPYGFVPAVMLQNLPKTLALPGKSDYEGTLDLQDALDMELSQAHRGTLYNSDPTLAVFSDKKITGKVMKGSSHAIALEKGASAKYLELSDKGPNMSLNMSDVLESKVLTQAQVVINPGTSNMTAEEVRRRFESMYDKADVLRAQYGELIERLLTMVVKAVAIGKQAGFTTNLPDVLPEKINLDWPEYIKSTSNDNLSRMQQIVLALQNGLMTKEDAIKKASRILNIEDVQKAIEELSSLPTTNIQE